MPIVDSYTVIENVDVKFRNCVQAFIQKYGPQLPWEQQKIFFVKTGSRARVWLAPYGNAYPYGAQLTVLCDKKGQANGCTLSYMRHSEADPAGTALFIACIGLDFKDVYFDSGYLDVVTSTLKPELVPPSNSPDEAVRSAFTQQSVNDALELMTNAQITDTPSQEIKRAMKE